MSTSFMSEHTAEYALVSKLTAIFSAQKLRIVPIFFLSTREGSKVSRQCDDSSPIRLISVFARRPKVEFSNQSNIAVTINAELFQAANRLTALGIPTFAGAPLISSIMDFSLDANVVWFELTGEMASGVYLQISMDGTRVEFWQETSAIRGPVHDKEIVEIFLSKSRLMQWTEAIEILRMNRRASRNNGSYWLPFGGGYHPFYLIVL